MPVGTWMDILTVNAVIIMMRPPSCRLTNDTLFEFIEGVKSRYIFPVKPVGCGGRHAI